MIDEEKVLDAEMEERIDVIAARIDRLGESINSFVLEFRQMLRTELEKHLRPVSVRNLSSGWRELLVTKLIPAKEEAIEKKQKKQQTELNNIVEEIVCKLQPPSIPPVSDRLATIPLERTPQKAGIFTVVLPFPDLSRVLSTVTVQRSLLEKTMMKASWKFVSGDTAMLKEGEKTYTSLVVHHPYILPPLPDSSDTLSITTVT